MTVLCGFWRDCIFKVTWCNQFKFLVFGNIKWVFRWFAFLQANIFCLKLKRILTKINISWVKSWRTRPTPSCVNLTQTVGRFDMWETPKTNKPSFRLILKLSNALDDLFSVYYIGCEVANINALFCWMNHHCWMWLLSDIVAWDSF